MLCPLSDGEARGFLMRATVPIVLLMALSCLSTGICADYSAGLDAYKRGNYAVAVQEWRGLAEAGHAQTQVSLGWLYLKGRGVSQDDVAARQLFEKAAVQGNVEAQYNLARLYYSGQGGKQDYAQACLWYEKAALQGSADAQVNLGTFDLPPISQTPPYVGESCNRRTT